jgi:hypothetical protein
MLLVSNLHANENPFSSKLPFKEGIIHYTITGSKQGTQTTYIRNYGKERLIYKNSHSKIMHTAKQDEDIIMITPTWVYHINLLTKEATKEPNINAILIKEFNKLPQKRQAQILKREGKKLLNFSTLSYTLDGVKMTITKKGNLLLHSQSGILGYTVNTIATDIEIKDINASLFSLPKGIKIHEKRADTTQAKKIIEALISEKKIEGQKERVDYHMIIQEGIHALDF